MKTIFSSIALMFAPLWTIGGNESAYPISPADTSGARPYIMMIRMCGYAYTDGLLAAPDINLLFRLGKESDSFLGMYGDYAVFHRPGSEVRGRYVDISQKTWHVGISYAYQTASGWHFHSTVSKLTGTEELITLNGIIGLTRYSFVTETRKVSGYDLSLGTFYNNGESPLALGLEIFARQSNGKAMADGAGLKISLGIRF